MCDKLFIINYCIEDIYNNKDNIIGIYIDLERAKNELRNIYLRTIDYKYYNYKINIYNLINGEYIPNNLIYYTYSFDEFIEIERMSI